MSRRKPTPPVVSTSGSPAKPGPVRVPRVNSSKVSLLDTADDPWLPAEDDSHGSVVEFPKPRKSRRRLYLILGLITLVLLIGGLLAYLIFSPALALRSVEVTGNSLVTSEEATEALEPLLGIPLPQISDEQVAELMDGFAPIESVTVAAVPPSGLAVNIRERVPVAILQSSGQFLLIDEDGRQLASVTDRDAVQLPLIDGGTDAVNSEVFSSIAAVLAALPESILNQLNHASADSVDSVELSLANDQTIFWGSAEQNEAKALVLEALLEAPPADPPAKVFDVSTPSRPVTR
ncbi:MULTISPECIES: cell division protein FtsQ/DivIB [unclassified Arthrobacter]|uniref:cell division protein FtsQ/DivIB n=1 Tax=unclassified Arthrobacter TaxID=235627 RepID=UPI001490A625|nr:MULTISPECIES: cell division protein FtsQ/DivIB [unclassified Arthrobacter]MBE0009864.1 peptidase S33 [Arthrobacter sp. AET 35A]NOJ59815.1 FtsQ-type POTRA domain-containing protein [Arthrobacter sp. 260]NOJ63796.1 FtsQ-type POTRA domain-containing protein [Arthrobacter sp. 147(2020)]